jgi:GH25 family lysozyme M1 (1,4-beta-N-acetylmuramidase)
MIYGTDWGAYLTNNQIALPFADLMQAGLCDFFICKGAQDIANISTIVNVEAARAEGVPVVGCYYWQHPTWGAQYQIDVYSEAIGREKPDFIALDMEDTEGKSSLAVSENAKFLVKGLKANFPNKPLFLYTSQNYINVSAPDCNSWIGGEKIWIASWPDWGAPHPVEERFRTYREIKDAAFPTFNPYVPTAWKGKRWDFWQYGTWQIPEGYGYPYYHQYDWNAFNGTLDDLKALCGLQPVTPPGPTLEERVTDLDARMKKIESLPWYHTMIPTVIK